MDAVGECEWVGRRAKLSFVLTLNRVPAIPPLLAAVAVAVAATLIGDP